MKHFVAENVLKRTIFAMLKSGTIEEISGSGRKALIMTNKNKEKLKYFLSIKTTFITTMEQKKKLLFTTTHT